MALKSSATAADDHAEKMVATQESDLLESKSNLGKIEKEKAILENKVVSVKNDIEVLNANLSVEESKTQELKNQIQSLSVLNEFLKNLHTLISRLVMKSEVRQVDQNIDCYSYIFFRCFLIQLFIMKR